MSAFWLQIIAVARDDDGEVWMQLLIFIILAVFWVIGGIMKAKRNKAGEYAEDGSQAPKHSTQMPQYQRISPAYTKDQNISQPAARPLARKPQRPTKRIQAAQLQQKLVPPVTAKPQRSLEFIPKPLQPVAKKLVLTTAAESVPTPGLDLWRDYDDVAGLRRAILHYEILGKPLALREHAANLLS